MRKLIIGLILTFNQIPLIANDCDEAVSQLPDAPSARGPYEVGARTLTVTGRTLEVWYPSDGPTEGITNKFYDLRDQLPDNEGNKIPDKQNPIQNCDCFADLTFAEGLDQRPLIVYVHGTAAFRTQALPQMTHWASRGFVVIAMDHPRIRLKDILSRGGFLGGIFANQKRDVRRVVAALKRSSTAPNFLQNKIDFDRIALAGHSAGGNAIAGLGDLAGVKVLIPMAANQVSDENSIESTLVLAAGRDGVVSPDSQLASYDRLEGPKTLVTIKNAGHLAYSEICSLGRDDGGILAIAQRNSVNVPNIVARLGYDGCADDFIEPTRAFEIINYASTAVLEETLYCSSKAGQALKDIASRFGEEIDFKQLRR